MMILAPMWQSLCPTLTACGDRHNVLGVGAAAEKCLSAFNTEQAYTFMVIRAVWICHAANLSSFANCNVIRKEKGENGLFLSKSFASFKAEDKQTQNNHGNQIPSGLKHMIE